MKLITFIFLISISLTGKAQLKFQEVPQEVTNISFENTLIETPQTNPLIYQYYHNGSGVCAGDINNDGLPDLYFVSNMGKNLLYLNKGNLEFEDISNKSEVHGGQGWATGATMVDINNDGFLDVYVCKSGILPDKGSKNKLYVNQGDLTFKEEAAKYGLDDSSNSSQAYFLDFDKDGDLDLFLLNHPIVLHFSNKPAANPLKKSATSSDKFFKNENGKFVDISDASGIELNSMGYGLSAAIGDYNNDGFPDIYVCNDFLEHDYLYINTKNGSFIEKSHSNLRHISNFSMGSDVADINNDGLLDIMIADMAAEDNYRSKANMSGMNPERFWRYVDNGFHYQYMINTLQLNNGEGSFSEIAQLAGVSKTDWSWAPLLADFNQDGLVDLFVSNGLRKEARNNDFVKKKIEYMDIIRKSPDSTLYYMRKILDEMPSQKISNYLFTNKGNLKFDDELNEGMETPTFSTGTTYADLDNDGDLDLITNNIDSLATIYENKSVQGNYLKVSLNGSDKNKFGIGAKVTVKTNSRVFAKELYLTRGYLSSVSEILSFGLGDENNITRISVEWTDGKVSILENVAVNQTITINYHENTNSAPIKHEREILSSSKISLPFVHTENSFDDFSREILLPHKMSTLGPDMDKSDINNDGLDDFYICGASGQNGQLFIQLKGGTFSPVEINHSEEEQRKIEETVAHFFDFDGDGDEDLYIGAGGNEFLNGSKYLQDRLYINEEGKYTLSNLLPQIRISTGCVSSGDFDGDGDLDLFVGNRQTPSNYPHPTESYILENIDGRFQTYKTDINSPFKQLGMVTSATWNDLNEDGELDLILCGEWMGITVLEQVNGVFSKQSAKYGLNNTTGWWFDLKIADLDGDGDMDLVAGNLGLNYKYRASENAPFYIYSEDLNEDGKNDIVLGYSQNGKTFPLRGRQCSSEQIPEIKETFASYNEFALATLEDVYGQNLTNVLNHEVKDFSSCIFINDNGIFRRKNFSHELQMSNYNAIEVEDINNDGYLDIVAAGNLYGAEVETPRCDAGNGIILLGDGQGEFKKINSTHSEWGKNNVNSLLIIKIGNQKALLIGNNNKKLEALLFAP